ncbi:pre-B-cell leukemia homeobox interacting protein 1b [Nerophis lumbriciformis]|uniref:pre-B-cell leukemia homeobox interacting protein 1b n=1 Tax=Nerophis lumbriciformis TaxID=546530 RepID=UPI002ADF213D|nr:pre-B-cell leukemia homeobox interacting protein 1b [Nerophis lumbriciformis]XP_061838557.1 pre-B-cell leukemia homeobox interacting protein 1b [Nerophis lumbriciformis]
MSGGNSANNSWTIVSPEEPIAGTVRPLEDVTKHHEQGGSPSNQPAEDAASSWGFTGVDRKAADERKEDLSGDSDRPSAMPSSVTDDPVLSHHALADSTSHVTPSSDESPGSPLSTETLGGAELTSEGRLTQEGAECLLQKVEDQQQEGEDSHLAPTCAEKHTDSQCLDEEKAAESKEQADTEEKRRTLLASLERIGRIDEEEEEGEEEFQLPQREDDSMFSLNRCILGAVILVSLGTILFSGVFMDLDDDSDSITRDFRDSEEPGKQEWLHPEVPSSPVDADSSELLSKIAKGNQQISVLQAQLQVQKEELKAAKGQAAKGESQRLRWEEENSRLKSEMASLPLLQEENERMKRELETLPTLQKELETLRTTVTEWKRTVPPSGPLADAQQAASPKHGKEQRETFQKKDKHDRGEKKEWKESKKSEWKEGERHERKEAKSVIREQDKVKKGEGRPERKNEEKEWKKEKVSRGDEGKMWKEKGEKTERKEWKEDKEWKKDKHEKKTKEWRGGKDEGETHKMKDKWNGGKKVKDGSEEHGKEKWERSEKKKKKDGTWMNKDPKEERKHCEDSKKQEREKDEWKNQNRKGDPHSMKAMKKGRRKEDSGERREDPTHGDVHTVTGYHRQHQKEHLWTSPLLHQDQADYWTQQRNRLHRKPKAPEHCPSLEACAQAEGLRPVPFAQFQTLLQAYLAKAEQAGVDSSQRDALQKLAGEFFRDGVFVHERANFRRFVKDVADILEDMVEEDDEDGEDSALEDEMEAFGREAVERFLAAGGETHKGDGKKGSGRASG